MGWSAAVTMNGGGVLISNPDRDMRIGTDKSASVYQRTCSGNPKYWTSDGL